MRYGVIDLDPAGQRQRRLRRSPDAADSILRRARRCDVGRSTRAAVPCRRSGRRRRPSSAATTPAASRARSRSRRSFPDRRSRREARTRRWGIGCRFHGQREGSEAGQIVVVVVERRHVQIEPATRAAAGSRPRRRPGSRRGSPSEPVTHADTPAASASPKPVRRRSVSMRDGVRTASRHRRPDRLAGVRPPEQARARLDLEPGIVVVLELGAERQPQAFSPTTAISSCANAETKRWPRSSGAKVSVG